MCISIFGCTWSKGGRCLPLKTLKVLSLQGGLVSLQIETEERGAPKRLLSVRLNSVRCFSGLAYKQPICAIIGKLIFVHGSEGMILFRLAKISPVPLYTGFS